MDLNYFVCTLGQAARHENKFKDFTNISDFIEQQAEQHGCLPAVGFYSPSNDQDIPWATHVLTFKDVFQGSCVFAEKLSRSVKISDKQAVALLCPSSSNFLLTWLGAMKLGHPVLLIAPQCSPNAVKELCRQCDCETLLYDETYRELAEASTREVEDGNELKLVPLPFQDSEVVERITQSFEKMPRRKDITPSDVAYLHHTSGTSTGIPKPIPQTHHAGAGVYTNLEGSDQATFSTTPLYHGGIADLFRAWTSHALIWLFPGKEVPITARNVVKCLEAAAKANTSSVRFFSSVPYVLEMMAEDLAGTHQLQKMAVVGVGGAALPTSVGDKLVSRDINLVSRFGSAECGFLMSSNRDFAKDKGWQYLRPDPHEEHLRFEGRESGLSELVILSGWPHMSKRNREDGSFATSDLLQPHPDIPGAWKYHSRADSQLTLITGKKFDPSPLESAITAASSLLSDVLIFGTGRPYPGALLFRALKAKNTPDEDLLGVLGPIMQELNEESQSHARIDRSMTVAMPWSEHPLEKSSKGTILRGKAEERYASNIESAYQQDVHSNGYTPDEDVSDRVLGIVNSIMATASSDVLYPDTDLFAFGVDSIACVRIRQAVSRLLPKGSEQLPLTIVQDCGNIARLSEVIHAVRQGRKPRLDDDSSIEHTMLNLVEQHSHFEPSKTAKSAEPTTKGHQEYRTIILTGPTGSLGAHLLHQLLREPNIRIHLLLRGASNHAAKERILKALQMRRLAVPDDLNDKVRIHTINVSKALLGLSEETYTQLARDVDEIFHLAWSVDFVMPLNGFKQHFAGLQTLLNLAVSHQPEPARLVFCSSTASLSGPRHPELIIEDPAESGKIGYSRSKWIAENILLRAKRSFPRLRLDVVRAGQLSGDSVHGIWNASEAYPLMLSAAKEIGCLPDLKTEEVRWVPVDVAAEAFVDLLREVEKDKREIGVYHVVNPRTTLWREFSSWILEAEGGLETVPASKWLEKLEKLRSKGSDQPCLKLLGFWKEAYGREEASDPAEEDASQAQYDFTKTCEDMHAVAKMGSIDKEYALKLWAWIKENV